MTEQTNTRTWTIPNILVAVVDHNGQRTQTVREGGPAPFVARTTREEVEAPVTEMPFVIRATNRINFGGGVISVINDEISDGDRLLAATSPTTAEYIALIGKEVLIAFSCRPNLAAKSDERQKAFIVGRTYITLR